MGYASLNSVFSLNLLLKKENFPYEVILIYQNNFFNVFFFGTSFNGGPMKAVSLSVVNAKDNYG